MEEITEVNRINDNANSNVPSSFKNLNDNVNDIEKNLKVDRIALAIADKLGGIDKSWEFYCKVAGALPESEIWRNVETATRMDRKITNPGGLFNVLCRKSAYRLKIKF